jgi:hypothetical protein
MVLLNNGKLRHGKILTSSKIVYARCWFSLLFCRTANIRRAPLRALERPIILAARSMPGWILSVMHIEIHASYLVLGQIAYDLHHLELATFPHQIVVQRVALTALLATWNRETFR